MALLYIDKFELGSIGVKVNDLPNSKIETGFTYSFAGSAYIKVVSGVLSEKRLVFRTSSTTYNVSGATFLPNESLNDKKITIGSAVMFSGNEAGTATSRSFSGGRVFGFGSADSNFLRVTSDGGLSLGDFTSEGGVIVDATWAYIEVVVDFSNGEFQLYVNNVLKGVGTIVFSGSKRITLCNPSSPTINAFTSFDDIYILDDTGTTHNQRLGPVRAVRVPFNSTTEANFTPFGAADNITAINKDSPNDSTFNRSPAANNVGDYFKLDTSVLPSDRPIIAVQQSAMYRKTDIGERALKLVAKEGVDRKEHPLPDRLVTFSGGPAQILETAVDGSAWDLTNLAATDFGYEVTE